MTPLLLLSFVSSWILLVWIGDLDSPTQGSKPVVLLCRRRRRP